MSLITDTEFVLYLFGITALVFQFPEILGKSNFYERHLKHSRHHDHHHWSYFSLPPSAKILSIMRNVMNAFLVVSSVHYLYTARDPVGDTNERYFVSIMSLYYTVFALKYLWYYVLFNFYKVPMGIFSSFFISFTLIASTAALIVLLALREAWLPFAFMFPPFFLFVFYIVWTYRIWSHFSQ